jgi:tRNA threonylcarbamoyladenosine biosynthesis protein TsaB
LRIRALQTPGVTTLALDTTTAAGSLAVARGSDVLLARRGDASRPHGERLPGDVVSLLAAAGLALGEVTLFAVASGPGAFTGLRIGIAAIQGLAFAHDRPVVAVSALDALALAASAGLAPGTRLAAWMDAARQEVFAALYEVPGGAAIGLPSIEGPSVGTAAATLARWQPHLQARRAAFVGDGAIRYWDAVRGAHPDARLVDDWPPLAASMIPLALDAASRGLAGPPHAVRPLYVRRSDAEIARDQRAAPQARDGR